FLTRVHCSSLPQSDSVPCLLVQNALYLGSWTFVSSCLRGNFRHDVTELQNALVRVALQQLDDFRPDHRLAASADASGDVDRRASLLILDIHSGAALDQRRDDPRA